MNEIENLKNKECIYSTSIAYIIVNWYDHRIIEIDFATETMKMRYEINHTIFTIHKFKKGLKGGGVTPSDVFSEVW